MKRTVFIPIEVFVREYDAKMLLAVELANAGFRVIIGRTTEVMEAASCVGDKDIYIINSLQKQVSDIINSSFSRNNMMFFSWDEEGVCTLNDKRFLRDRVNRNTIREMTGIFCWGNHEKELIESYDIESRGKVYCVGNPRLDVLGDNVKIQHKNEVDNIKKKYGKYIVVTSNGVLIDRELRYKNIERIRGYELSQDEIEEFEKMADYKLRTNQVRVEWIKQYAMENQDINIIVRPHPSEKTSEWEELFKGYNNIIVNKDYSINVWLGSADLLIHDGCTTALEAYISRVPSIICRPYNEEYYKCFPAGLSVEVSSYEEFSCFANTAVFNRNNDCFFTEEKSIYMSDYISLSDKSCSERIKEILINCCGVECSHKDSFFKWIILVVKWNMRNIRHNLMKYNDYKWPYKPSYSTVKKTLDRFAISKGGDGHKQNIRCKKISSYIYEIQTFSGYKKEEKK